MSKKYIVKCSNCGAEAPNKTFAKNDGWLMDWYEDEGLAFCCCVCKSAYDRQKNSKSKK